MKHTIESATKRATELGYRGKYIAVMAAGWVGKTETEITWTSAEFNRDYLRRQKYGRAAAIEADPDRKAHLLRVAG